MRWSAVNFALVVATGWLVLFACDSTISLGHDERPMDGRTTADADDGSTNTTGTSPTGSGEERDETSEGGAHDSETGEQQGDTTQGDPSAEDGTTFEATDDEAGDDTVDACNFDPRDGECLNCVKSFCCLEAQSCANEPGCACMAGCLSGAGMPSACMQQCDPNTESMQLALCIGMSCPGACS